MVQLSYPYMTTGKTIALARWTFVAMSLLFIMLSRLVIAFLPRSKHLLISWLQSTSAVISSSVQFSCSVVSSSLRPHESQHARPPCPSPTPEACSNSCPSSWWCGQSIGVSASASVLPMNTQDWFPLGLSGLISLQSKGLSRVFSNNTVQKHQFFSVQPSLWSNSHIHT